MKKTVLLLVVTVLLVGFSVGEAGAAMDTGDIDFSNTPFNKLTRGAVNMLTCPLELPAAVADPSSDKNILMKILEGAATTVARFGTGAFDVVTCIIPPYDKPILRPEYAFENFQDKTGAGLE